MMVDFSGVLIILPLMVLAITLVLCCWVIVVANDKW